MRRLTLLLSVFCFLLVAAPAAFAQSGDSDGDGVSDNADRCPNKFASSEDGCPVFRALINYSGGYDLGDVADDKASVGQAQCYVSGDDLCSFTATLTLDAASARKLGLRNRQIGSMKATTNKQQSAYDLRFVNFRWGISTKVKRALRKAKSVTLTMAGTYARGSGEPQKFKPVTFKAVKNHRGNRLPSLDTRPPRPESESDG